MANTAYNSRRAAGLLPVYEAWRAQRERVVIITLGDSTARKTTLNFTSGKYGWPLSLAKSLNNSFGIPMVATPFWGAGAASGEQGLGFGCHQSGSMTSERATETPSSVAAWANLDGVGLVSGLEHLAAWSANTNLGTSTSLRAVGLSGSDIMGLANVYGDPSPIDTAAAVRMQMLHGVDATGGSSTVEFSPGGGAAAARGSGTINYTTATESYGITGRTAVNSSAAATVRDLYAGWVRRSTTVTAPAMMLGMSVEDPAQTWGFSYHPLYEEGSKTMGDCATSLEATHADWQKAYFSFLRYFATGTPKKVVVVPMFGFNDTSAGGGNNTAAVWKANFLRIRTWFRSAWTTNGWDLNELFFCPTPSWQQSDPDDSDIITYRATAEELEREYPQTQSLDPMRVLDWSVLKNLYDRNTAGTTDYLHISRQGYDVIGHAMAMQLLGMHHAFRLPRGRG